MARRATLKDVAERAQVSTATVSYVLNDKKSISEQTKARVYDAIRDLNYVPDLSARSLSSRDSKLIGIVIPQTEPGSKLMLQNDFYSEIVGSIEYHARQHGYHVIISATDVNESYLTLAKERNLDGIIVIGMYPDDFYRQMKKTQIPIVLIDSYCNDHYYHSIRIDDAYGSYHRYVHRNSFRSRHPYRVPADIQPADHLCKGSYRSDNICTAVQETSPDFQQLLQREKINCAFPTGLSAG